MLTTIHITVCDRVPTITAGEDVISHNSDYVAEFVFDEEWQDKVKTVYFVCEDGSYQAVVMSGNSCDVPMMAGEHRRIFVGVQAGSAEKPSVLKTTRPCCLKVKDSIADYLGQPIPDPTPDVYEQIIAMLNNLTTPTWNAILNKPFESLGDGLSVENGVLSAKGGTGGSANAVQYVAQELTDEQKKQARTNIGASPIPKVRNWLNLKTDNIINLYNMDVGYGIISPVGYDQTVPTGMSSPMLVIFGEMHYGKVDITVYDGAGAVWRGSLNLSSQTTNVTKTGDYVTNTALTDILQGYVSSEVFDGVLSGISQAFDKKLDKNQGTDNAGKILGVGEDGNVIPQDKPTYTLPQATADALGGIKADAATAEDTQDVRIGADGKLKTKPTGGSSVTVDSELSSTSANPVQNKVVTAALAEKITAPTTAAVGQIIKVKSVDTAGKPTEWEAADLSSGGSDDWTLLAEQTTTEIVREISFTLPKSVKHVVAKIWCPATGAEAVNRYISVKIGASYLFYYIAPNIPDKTMTSQLTVTADSIGGGYWRLSYYANRGVNTFDKFDGNNQNESVVVGVTKAAYTEANTFAIMTVATDTTQQFPAGTILKVWGC